MSSLGILNTAAGSKLYIGTTATNGLTDSYTEVGNIASLGDLGRVYELITFKTLGDRNVLKFKGPRNDGAINIELGKTGSDSGQAAMLVALDDDHDYNFKVTLNDATTASGASPTTYVFKAKVMSFPVSVGGPNNVVTAKPVLEIKSNSITEIGAQ